MAEPTLALSNPAPKLETETKGRSTKRVAIYARVSTADQHPETQLYDLREMAKQRSDCTFTRLAAQIRFLPIPRICTLCFNGRIHWGRFSGDAARSGA